MFAKFCGRIICGLLRTFDDLRGQQKFRDSVADFRRLSKTFEDFRGQFSSANVSENPRSDFTRLDFRGHSQTFAEKDFSFKLLKCYLLQKSHLLLPLGTFFWQSNKYINIRNHLQICSSKRLKF